MGNKIDEVDIIPLIRKAQKEIEDESSYFGVRKKIEEKVAKLENLDENMIDNIHPLLNSRDESSILFALGVIKKVKSVKSLPFLISFIKKNEKSDYWPYCDGALFALRAIGNPAVEPLLNEIKSDFSKKEYFGYLVGALIDIKDERVYSFMNGIVNDYLKDLGKYEGWFKIDGFVHGFFSQEHKEVLSSLKNLLKMEHLSENEKIEIDDTIERIENPEKVKKEMDEITRGFKKFLNLKKDDINVKQLLNEAIEFEQNKQYEKGLESLTKILSVYPDDYYAKFIATRIKRKTGKPDLISINDTLTEAKKQKASKEEIKEIKEESKQITQLLQERQLETNEDVELNFKCLKCGKRQNIKLGGIWQIGDKDNFSFDNEVMCKYCFNHNMKLTEYGELSLSGSMMRMLQGNERGFLYTDEMIYVENKKMHFSQTKDYLLKRIKEDPFNGEIYLRAANNARKFNEYEKAIEYYKRAIELNPKLIAVYINLVEIYQHRYKYYKIKSAKNEAINYLLKMGKVFKNQDFDIATLRNPDVVVNFLGETSAELGLNLKREIGLNIVKINAPLIKGDELKQKIGRNESCPCGSGKKYKKCCLDKERIDDK